METLCGQAYGAKDYKTLGDVLQRALLVCWVACVPVALLWSQSTALMVAAGQDPAIADMAGRYLSISMPCIFIAIATDCLKKYLQAQHIVSPGMYATAAGTLMAPVFFYSLVYTLDLGLDGAAIAFVLCQMTAMSGLLGYTVSSGSESECGEECGVWTVGIHGEQWQ
jgi:MATE family multidrug resistance protein